MNKKLKNYENYILRLHQNSMKTTEKRNKTYILKPRYDTRNYIASFKSYFSSKENYLRIRGYSKEEGQGLLENAL